MQPARPPFWRFLAFFFRQLYTTFSFSYDLVAWTVSLGRWKSWVRSVLPELEGPMVLELGHGPGHLQIALSEKGIQVVGVDLSQQMNELARKRMQRAAFSAKVVRANAERLPFPSQHFDQVVATFPTEFLLSPGTQSHVVRVLKVGGKFIVLPVAWITGKSHLERLLAGLFRATGQAGEWHNTVTKEMESQGFEVREKRIELKGSQVLLLSARKLRE